MPYSHSSSKKASPFHASSKKEWNQVAIQELGEGNPVEKLFHSVGGVEIQPYYDASDLPSQLAVQLPPSINAWGDVRFWSNTAPVTVLDSARANETALKLLNRGADGIFFELQNAPDIRRLLNGIELPFCTVFFSAQENHHNLPHDFQQLVADLHYDPASISGGIFWNKSPKRSAKQLDWPSFRSGGIVSTVSENISDELSSLLVQTISQIDGDVKSGIAIPSALQHIAFSLSLGESLFLNIAKCKALRSLWFRVAESYCPGIALPAFIHSSIQTIPKPAFEPHGEMISNTTIAMSAILGGCDAITIKLIENGSTRDARISLNVSSILREESHLNKVSDPVAGSYFVETLADQFARESWSKMQALLLQPDKA